MGSSEHPTKEQPDQQLRRAVRKRRNAILPLVLDICELLDETSPDGLSYIQIGAHDGILGDPMYQRACSGKWRGLLLEPSALYFRRLQEVHGDRESITLDNVGISKQAGDQTLYRLSDQAADLYPSYLQGCASLTRHRLERHLAAHLEPQDAHIIAETVQLDRLDAVLARHNIDTATGLIIDVEGHERAVFDSFELSQFTPRFIQYEHKHLTSKARTSIADKCLKAGYTVLALRNDTLCLEPDLARPGILRALERLGAKTVTETETKT